MISDRIRSGVQNAKSRGIKLGRPRTTANEIPDMFYKYYPRYKNGEITKTEFARLAELSYPSIYKYLRIVGE